MAIAATASSNASAANEAAESTRQLATGIGEIDPTARSLRDQAEALRTLVARFHIEPEELGATRSPVTSGSQTSSKTLLGDMRRERGCRDPVQLLHGAGRQHQSLGCHDASARRRAPSLATITARRILARHPSPASQPPVLPANFGGALSGRKIGASTSPASRIAHGAFAFPKGQYERYPKGAFRRSIGDIAKRPFRPEVRVLFGLEKHLRIVCASAVICLVTLVSACGAPHGGVGATTPQLSGGPSDGPDANVRRRSTNDAGDIVAINAGGSAVDDFSADTDYQSNGSWSTTTTRAIDTSGVSNPAPQAVYQSGRNGSTVAYTIPGLNAGARYTVRLDFAEIFWTSAAQRSFNIAINGAQVATDFDIIAAAGKADKAVALSFNATASSRGTIAITLTAVTNLALINGIEISPGALPSPPPSPPPVALNHVLVIGQSLSIGSYGVPALTTTQPFNNLMLNTGIVTGNQANANDLVSFAPLVESVLTGTNHGETGWAAAANLTTALTKSASPSSDYRMLISDDGASGYSYAQLEQGTAQYTVGLTQIKAAHAIAHAGGFNHSVRALFVVHGEQDQSLGTTNYESDLEAWQADYQSDIQAITGQTTPIPMFVSQLSGNWDAVGVDGNAATIPQAQLQASFDEPTKIYLVGPKYMLTFSNGPHLTNTSYRQMGEYFAKAYRSVIIEGKPWIPLRPQPASITCTEHAVDVAFDVPVPPLVFDTTLVAQAKAYGFSVVNGSGKVVPISSVSLTGPSSVHIALGSAISGSNNRLQYAYGSDGYPTCPPSALTCNGSQTGPRGNLRDSDSTRSLYGNKLYNWAVQFEEPCTLGNTSAPVR